MGTVLMRARILSAMGSAGFVAGVSAGACGGTSLESGSHRHGAGGEPAGTSGRGGYGTTNHGGAAPATAGGSAPTVGTGGVATAGQPDAHGTSGGKGGVTTTGPGGVGPISGSGGIQPAGAGGSAPVAGAGGMTAPVAGVGGMTAPGAGGSVSTGGLGGSAGFGANCWGISLGSGGVCCDEPEECMDLATALSMAKASSTSMGSGGSAGAPVVGDAGMAGVAGEAGGAPEPLACPAGSEFPHGFCDGYKPATNHDGLCCYVPWKGTCCGRPFVVAGEARLARAAERSDWGGKRALLDDELDDRTREELGRAWLADALMEHASVASFARFVLDLLAVGAPAVLVERAQAAIGDEIRHARLCFALAARYTGEALGPAALPTAEPARSVRLEELAATAVHEGCVGETLAALQAEAELASVSDARARETLEVIARDEASHAELSWAFVRWAIGHGGDVVKRAVRDAFRDAERMITSGLSCARPAVDVAAFAAHGRLLPSERAAHHCASFRDVIAPCAEVLLDAA